MTKPVVTNPVVWLQYLNEITLRWVTQSAQVIVAGTDEMSTGEHTVSSCVKTAGKLADLALLNGMEYATTLFAGPQFNVLPPVTSSKWYDIPGDQSCAHNVRIAETDRLRRFVSNDSISGERIGFEVQTVDGSASCTDGVLPAGSARFRIVVYRLGLHSGCYTGKVVVTPVPATADTPVQLDVEVEL